MGRIIPYDFSIDVRFNDIKNLVLENLQTVNLPSSGVKGYIAFDITYNRPAYYNGAQYRRLVDEDYVNTFLEGLSWKDECIVVTTANIVIGVDLQPGHIIDGITLVLNDRVLVKEQINKVQNGLYLCLNTPARASDMDTSAEFNNAVIPIRATPSFPDGSVWRCKTVNPNLGVDIIEFTSFSVTAPMATETSAGILPIADIPKMVAGLDDSSTVTPYKFKTYGTDPIWAILNKLIPQAPRDLAGLDLSITDLYTALEAGTGSSHSCTNNTVPEGVVLTFGPGDSGTLSAEIDSVVDGSRVLSVADDTGVYDSLQITSDTDPYQGQSGAGIYQQLNAKLVSDTALSLGLHTYQLKHSESGNSLVSSFYVDNPGISTISGIAYLLPSTANKVVSGVPSLAATDTISIDFTINGAVGKHYCGTRVARVSGSHITVLDIVTPSIPIENASIGIVNSSVSLLAALQTENVTLLITGYNSKNVAGTSSSQPTSARADFISVESTRLIAGSGQYPVTGYGGAFDSIQSLKTVYVEELQMLYGKYQWPSGNYSTNYIAGPNYSSGMGIIDRWVYFTPNVLSNASGFTLNILGAENMTGAETAGMKVYIKVEGITGWLDANKSYPGAGIPIVNGDSAMVYASSNGYTKVVTFGPTVRSGNLRIRIGLPENSTKKLTGISITNIV